MTKPTKYALAAIAGVLVALIGGYFGAGFRGGSTASAASDTGSWIAKIKSNGQLRVGVAIAPPMTIRDGGKLGGPNLIPLQDLASALGVKLVTVSADWNNIVAGLQANRYDVAANLNPTLKRATSIQFSDAVYSYQSVFVIKGDSSYSTSKQIITSGQQVAVPQGTAADEAIRSAGAKVLELTDFTNAFQAVQAGRAVAVFANLPTAESMVHTNPTYKIVVPDPVILESNAGYGLPANIDARSLELVNIAIHDAQMSGELERAYAKQNYVPLAQLGDMLKK